MVTATEARFDAEKAIDRLDPAEAVSVLIEAQCSAASVVSQACPEILGAAAAVAKSISGGGRVLYCGAGSSGLMALADALELPGTFGIAQDRAMAVIAGGVASLSDLAGGYEDDRDAGGNDLRSAGLAQGDCVIVVAASGRTPYALGAAESAKAAGATVIALANNAGTPLLATADIPILLATASEPLAGSTRLGAGTAQKIALNTISTMAGVLLGQVHDGLMVGLRADNMKLRDRAVRVVGEISGVDRAGAEEALAKSGGEVKTAVLLARGAASADEAKRSLDRAGQNLRKALELSGLTPQ